jgi:tetratricopeptide (TPR) repeat protein
MLPRGRTAALPREALTDSHGQTSALDATRRVFGDDHWETQSCRMSLALCYRSERRYAEGEALYRVAIDELPHGLPGHPMILQAKHQLGELYRQQGRFAEAESMFQEVVTARRRLLGQDNPYTGQALASLGQVRLDTRRYVDAEQPLRDALQAWTKVRPIGWEYFSTESMLGESLAGQGRRAEAASLLDLGFQGLLAHSGNIPADAQPLLANIRVWNDSLASSRVPHP